MTDKLLQYLVDKKHHSFRRKLDVSLSDEYSELGISAEERVVRRFEFLLKEETPVILEDEQITFLRTIENLPEIFSEEEWKKIESENYIHEIGFMSNIIPDYEMLLSSGLLKLRETASEAQKRVIDSIIELSDRYLKEAEKQGREDIAEVLRVVPRYPAKTLREAMQFLRIIHFSLWLEGDYHNCLGRLDKYMRPYFEADIEAGRLERASALELIKDFFLSFNKDSDLYFGQQQGDNGQSLVLGGMDEDGNEIFSEFSELCLIASKELKVIDPKINLRVNGKTSMELYEKASELTKEGLGFPQYSNDDVVIPALISRGYEEKDARNYAVAACWEFIVPAVGGDIANLAGLNLPLAVEKAMREHLENCETMEEFLCFLKASIRKECEAIHNGVKNVYFVPAPLLSLITAAEDITKGNKYNNFGIHGTGFSCAVDCLSAINYHVFDNKSITPADYIKALDSDFEGYDEFLARLRFETPKMGQDDDRADNFAVKLAEFCDAGVEGLKNCRGGIYRIGTGSAMYYLWHPRDMGASPDGRRKGEPFGANYAPSLFAKIGGPFSVVKSFSKPELSKIINGGPLTMEFHNGMFKEAEGIKKLAQLVKTFIDRGGHQFQLNTVSPDKLRDAKLHPENYRRLIVRIWGWSAYFVELDDEFQDHVILRQEYSL